MSQVIEVENKCKDYGDNPDCLGTIDEQYTMLFDDIGEEPLKWCSNCGKMAHYMSNLITTAVAQTPDLLKKLDDLVTKAELGNRSKFS